jgi:diacylglycerol O-acyltransferase
MGRQIIEIIPYVPIATTLRIGISIFTYCDNVTFGITGDFAANPDLNVLAGGIEHGISELLKAAGQQARSAASDTMTHAPCRTAIQASVSGDVPGSSRTVTCASVRAGT